jgi:hypothetical protein
LIQVNLKSTSPSLIVAIQPDLSCFSTFAAFSVQDTQSRPKYAPWDLLNYVIIRHMPYNAREVKM